MMRVEMSQRDFEKIKKNIFELRGEQLGYRLKCAAERAAQSGETAGVRRMCQVYNIKRKEAKSRIDIKIRSSEETLIDIRGPSVHIELFSGTKWRRKKGVFVSIKKGSGGLIPRSFKHGDTPLMREGAARYPIKGIYGPSVPQMFAEESVIEAATEAAMEMYKKRVIHELKRGAGGRQS